MAEKGERIDKAPVGGYDRNTNYRLPQGINGECGENPQQLTLL